MIVTTITEGFLVDAYTRTALSASLGRMLGKRREAACSESRTRLLEHAIGERIDTLIDMGCGAQVTEMLRLAGRVRQ